MVVCNLFNPDIIDDEILIQLLTMWYSEYSDWSLCKTRSLSIQCCSCDSGHCQPTCARSVQKKLCSMAELASDGHGTVIRTNRQVCIFTLPVGWYMYL